MVSTGIQIWTVPISAKYKIEAFGASGGNTGSSFLADPGAKVAGEISSLQKGDKLHILVGQMGTHNTGSSSCQAGGGGGARLGAFREPVRETIGRSARVGLFSPGLR